MAARSSTGGGGSSITLMKVDAPPLTRGWAILGGYNRDT